MISKKFVLNSINRYDRQIHIWGAENQKKLISSTIAFAYCDSLCVEVMIVYFCKIGCQKYCISWNECSSLCICV